MSEYVRKRVEGFIAATEKAQAERGEPVTEFQRQLRAAARKPHFFIPSTMHMGDCAICGNTQEDHQT